MNVLVECTTKSSHLGTFWKIALHAALSIPEKYRKFGTCRKSFLKGLLSNFSAKLLAARCFHHRGFYPFFHNIDFAELMRMAAFGQKLKFIECESKLSIIAAFKMVNM